MRPNLAALVAAAAALTLGGRAGAAEPLAAGVWHPSAHQIAVRCDAELDERRRALAALERRAEPGKVLEEINAVFVRAGNFDDPLEVLQAAAPDKELRAAAQACAEKLVPFANEFFQSAKVQARLQALVAHDAQDESYRAQLLEHFEDAGSALPEGRRERARAIQDELDSLALRFERNLEDVSTTLTLTPAEAEGLTEDWRAARLHDAAGNFLLNLDYPTVVPFLQHAVHADARQRVWLAFENRAGRVNLDLIDRALVLRSELAQIHGFPDFASWSLRRTMAGSPEAVSDFLVSVKAAVDRAEADELDELRQEKARLAGVLPDDVRVERWDVGYLVESVRRRRYHVDDDALRANFPTEASVRFVLRVAESLFGLRFEARAAPAWHPDVRYLEVYDADAGRKKGAYLGGLYLDLFARDGKSARSEAFGVRSASTLVGQRPVQAVLIDLDRGGLTPARLQVLLHEMGHALHGLLSRTRYAQQAGDALRRDFVEVPPQMFEEWAWHQDSLRHMADACPECPLLSAHQVAQIDAARRFGLGLSFARQWLYASYDLALHTGAPKSALATWEEMEGASRLGHVAGTLMPASFGHLMSGNEAGYYAHVWSEVLSQDLFSPFAGRMLDPALGLRYRSIVLEPGGSRPPQDLILQFLGRKPGPEAFFQWMAGRR